jgi:hypothetical protein
MGAGEAGAGMVFDVIDEQIERCRVVTSTRGEKMVFALCKPGGELTVGEKLDLKVVSELR